MESEFDKEIDVLLRQTIRGDGSSVAENFNAHLDADEINAFAAQKLSDKARLRAIEHFADCSRCRKILANLTAFNREAESEIVHQPEKKLAAIPAAPWYKKLFSFPQLAYATGILTLVFGGIITIVVLKSSTQNTASDVARIEPDAKFQSLAPAGVSTGSNANSGASNASNMSMNSNAATTVSKDGNKAAQTRTNAPSLTNSSAMAQKDDAAKSSSSPKLEQPTAAAEKEKREMMIAAAPPAPVKENNYTTDEDSAAEANRTARKPVSQDQTGVQKKTEPETKNIQSLPVNGRQAQSLKTENRTATVSGGAVLEADKIAETKTAVGKKFRRSDGVWYDVNYKNQKTINVRRNSDEYKKLDANLRSIADSLGGVVVIVSGGKAYRIQ